jgi:hypothetical protein
LRKKKKKRESSQEISARRNNSCDCCAEAAASSSVSSVNAVSVANSVAPVFDASPSSSGSFDLVFVGTGVSTAVPNLGHVLGGSDDGSSTCRVSEEAYRTPGSKNRLNNFSLVGFRDSLVVPILVTLMMWFTPCSSFDSVKPYSHLIFFFEAEEGK